MRLVPAAARPSARRLCVQAEGARRYSSGPSWAASQESDSNSVHAECPPSVCRTGPTRVTTDPNDPPRRSNAERVGRAGDMSSDSLSVADSLRTSSKGPRLATVASPLHFMYLRARLEGLEPPTNGFEGRMRRTQGVARLRNRLQLLGTRQAWIPGSRRLSHRSPRILRTGCGRC